MKSLSCFLIALLILTGCQMKRYYGSSPEIDLVKKGNEAYFKGDWQTLRSIYSDSAKIWFNTWPFNHKALSPDEVIGLFKQNLESYSEYKEGENTVVEMVINDSDEKWVHCWLEWRGKTKSGKEVTTMVHLSSLVKDGKIVTNAILADGLPGYLATHPVDSVTAK